MLLYHVTVYINSLGVSMPSIVGLSRNYSKPYREIRLVAC
ncbi:hypothetical protein ALT1000_190033 [Alteromonas macleodii]